MNKEKLEFIAILLVGILAAGLLSGLLVRYLLPVVLPFIIAWGVALATRVPAAALSKKTRVPEHLLRLFISLFVTLILFGVAALVVWRLTAALWSFLSGLGEGSALYDLVALLSNPPIIGDRLPPELLDTISGAADAILERALTALADLASSLALSVPRALFFLFITVIALVYFTLDLERINAAVRRILPERCAGVLSRLKKSFFLLGKRYLRSYLLLFLITFTIMLVGLFILGREHAFVIALLISVLDILPVIGVGTVLIPWSILSFAGGSHGLGVGLIVLFLVNLFVRQLTEPRIVGRSLDMHPVLTLILLYVGYSLFGIGGVIAVPVVSLALGALFYDDSTPEVDEGRGTERDGNKSL